MGKLSIKPIRLRNLGKNKTREQQSTKQNHPAKDASNANNDGYDVNNNKREINQHPVSEYGTRQAVSSSYIVRRRLANLLEERFPGRWSMIEVCAHRSVQSGQADRD